MKKMSASKFILKLSLLVSSVVFSISSFAQTEDSKKDIPSFKMTGDVSLLSNYVEHGLTQTAKDPSLQAAFGFNFGPQFKLGLWGSNVNFDSTEHFLLKLNAELKIQISTTTDFKVGFNNNRYFKTVSRDGSTTYVLVTSHGYRIRYENDSNWEGTESSATHYSFGKAYDLSPTWKWDNEAGYNMISDVDTMSNYFDLRTGFLYRGIGSNVIYQMTATGTSAASQFTNGQGDVSIHVGASTSF
jgi:uncharacterized protein (TIGR02001 family)